VCLPYYRTGSGVAAIEKSGEKSESASSSAESSVFTRLCCDDSGSKDQNVITEPQSRKAKELNFDFVTGGKARERECEPRALNSVLLFLPDVCKNQAPNRKDTIIK